MSKHGPKLRPATPEDHAQIASVWFRSGKAAYPYLQDWRDMTPEKAAEILLTYILPGKETWVATDQQQVRAFLNLEPHFIDRLYVDPPHQRQGWGDRLLELAKSLNPDFLELYTHQANHSARAFYEKRNFRAIAFGISPPPESAPDVKYRWDAPI